MLCSPDPIHLEVFVVVGIFLQEEEALCEVSVLSFLLNVCSILLKIQSILAVDGDELLLLVCVGTFVNGFEICLGASECSDSYLNAPGLNQIVTGILLDRTLPNNDECILQLSDEFGLGSSSSRRIRVAFVSFSLHEANGKGCMLTVLFLNVEARHGGLFASFKINLDEAEYGAAAVDASLPREGEQVEVLAILQPLMVSFGLS